MTPYASLFLYINAVHTPKVARKQVALIRELELSEAFA
jgi:hypothetical protein